MAYSLWWVLKKTVQYGFNLREKKHFRILIVCHNTMLCMTKTCCREKKFLFYFYRVSPCSVGYSIVACIWLLRQWPETHVPRRGQKQLSAFRRVSRRFSWLHRVSTFWLKQDCKGTRTSPNQISATSGCFSFWAITETEGWSAIPECQLIQTNLTKEHQNSLQALPLSLFLSLSHIGRPHPVH